MADQDAPAPRAPNAWLDLLDWRRQVSQLYAEVRALWPTDPPAAHAHWRQVRDALFRRHPQSPLDERQRARFGGLRYQPYNPALAFIAGVRAEGVTDERFELDTGTPGERLAFRRIGLVDLPVGPLELFWLEGYGGGLFLPFRDRTNGHTTYGGGRYLLDTTKGADLGSTPDGRLVLDFNFAYHPSCHYNPRWLCPLAPPANWLEASIEAGELAYED